MPDISPSEYIDSLLITYQYLEKFYNQAISDVIAAEVRRDEAKKIKDEALTRLEDAREKYGTPDVIKDDSPSSDNTTTGTPLTDGRPPSALTRNNSFNNGKDKPVRRKPIKKAIAESESSRRTVVEEVEESGVVSPNVDDKQYELHQESPSQDDIILSPTTGQKKTKSSRKIAVEKVEESGMVDPSVDDIQQELQQVSPTEKIPTIGPRDIFLSPTVGQKKTRSSREIAAEEGVMVEPSVDDIQHVSPTEKRPSILPPDTILSATAGQKKTRSSRKIVTEKVEESGMLDPSVHDMQQVINHVSPIEKRQTMAPPAIILSPTAGHKKVPKIFLTNPESPRKRSSNAVVPESPRRRASSGAVPLLLALDEIKSVLTISQGRNRDWFDKNFDCEAHGIVKKFYQATFSTKTSEKTKKVTVKTIVLNDEWNDLVTDTSQIQEMYIGKSPDNDVKPTFRDRAAEALVNPPQQDPIALFFAPKHSLNTNEIYYGGHWKVVDGEMLQPPRLVKGQLQQCLARFAFVGIDRHIVEAINKGI